MTRRSLLACAACAACGAIAAGMRIFGNPDARSRLSVLSWSFRNLFARTRDRGIPAPRKDFDILGFPQMIADRYGIHNVEVQSMYFASTTSSYLREFARRLSRANARLVDIPLEFDDEPDPRRQSLRRTPI